MARTFDDALRWVEFGTGLVKQSLATLSDADLAAPSGLPGWTRSHVVAHLAANAGGIGNLVHWAATGEPTPMYPSWEQRDADIETGSTRSRDDLVSWFASSAAHLARDVAALPADRWQAEVVTMQGATVPAGEAVWMRAREVLIHGVDLAAGIRFADLPTDFLTALTDDIVAKRSREDGPALRLLATDTGQEWEVAGSGGAVAVAAPVADLAAWLAGRPSAVDTDPVAPALARWV